MGIKQIRNFRRGFLKEEIWFGLVTQTVSLRER
jgi:hypothetical protein